MWFSCCCIQRTIYSVDIIRNQLCEKYIVEGRRTLHTPQNSPLEELPALPEWFSLGCREGSSRRECRDMYLCPIGYSPLSDTNYISYSMEYKGICMYICILMLMKEWVLEQHDFEGISPLYIGEAVVKCFLCMSLGIRLQDLPRNVWWWKRSAFP